MTPDVGWLAGWMAAVRGGRQLIKALWMRSTLSVDGNRYRQVTDTAGHANRCGYDSQCTQTPYREFRYEHSALTGYCGAKCHVILIARIWLINFSLLNLNMHDKRKPLCAIELKTRSRQYFRFTSRHLEFPMSGNNKMSWEILWTRNTFYATQNVDYLPHWPRPQFSIFHIDMLNGFR